MNCIDFQYTNQPLPETIMTETLLTRLLLATGLFAGLMFGIGNAAAGITLAVLAGSATWLVRSQDLLQGR